MVLDVKKKYVLQHNFMSKYTSVFNKNTAENYGISGSKR